MITRRQFCLALASSALLSLKDVPIWAFHGAKDEAVNIERSRKMIAAVRQAGGHPKYTEYPNEGHAIWDKVFREPELLPWVFAQKSRFSACSPC